MSHTHTHSHIHSHGHEDVKPAWRKFIAPGLSLLMMAAGMIAAYCGEDFFANGTYTALFYYIISFLPVGLPVVREAGEAISAGDIFNEFTLMVIACIGAFCIGEYPEAVGVMVFYTIGETLQDMAVGRATKNISALLDLRPERSRLIRDGQVVMTAPADVHPGDEIEVCPGERVPLDGILLSAAAPFDTSALTGESIPRTYDTGAEVPAGLVSAGSTIRLRVIRDESQSALSRILAMVRNAAGRKASTELFIRRFARIYTPVVLILAVLIVTVPWILSQFIVGFDYTVSQWLYNALIFLVISCPCALVISVPLGYFAGIGAASRCGILFKGGNYLDALARVDTVAFDKTGTMTTGKFTVVKIEDKSDNTEMLLRLMAAVEGGSSHPLARTIVDIASDKGISIPEVSNMKETPGYGVEADFEGDHIAVGNGQFMTKLNVKHPEVGALEGTAVYCAVDGVYRGNIILSDTLKPDAVQAVADLRRLDVKKIVMLSGDRQEIAERVGQVLKMDDVRGELRPEHKAAYMEPEVGHLKAFVGDGMNDAPVLAVSDVGIAMGGLGSQAAIESADVVIQTDSPSRVATAVRIGRFTRVIVMQNIIGAISIKVAILTLGAFGAATLWEAVFADVGVSLLAVLNAMRIMWQYCPK